MLKTIKFHNIINPAVYFLLISGLILLFGKSSWWPDWYHPYYFGIMFISAAVSVILLKYIFKTADECRQEAVTLLRSAVAIAFVLNAWGELYLYQLYKYGFQYDKLLHFFDVFLFVIVFTFFITTWDKYRLKQALKISIFFVLIGSLIWEFFEYASDLLFNTSQFGVYGRYVVSDTIFDLLADMAGMVLGLYVLLSPKLASRIINKYCHWPIVSKSDQADGK